jgi:NAD(P)-dependent dehydrogenase (short-subunit alcohol dehydrogenase family)
MKQRIPGKVALVVGAGSDGPGWGNGKATAVLYARHGAKVFAVDRNGEAVEETRRLIEAEGGHCVAHVADVTQADAVRAMVEHCLAAYGRVDILHNNVGTGVIGGPVEASEESWDHVFNVNVKSAFLTCKHVLPLMVEQGGGAIVNISSIAAIRWSGVSYISYNASKAALNQFTQTVALEYAGRGVRCNAVMPGLMDTPHVYHKLAGQYGDGGAESLREARRRQVPLGVPGDAWDIAHAALFLASDEAKYVTGTVLTVDGGMTCSMVLPQGA